MTTFVGENDNGRCLCDFRSYKSIDEIVHLFFCFIYVFIRITSDENAEQKSFCSLPTLTEGKCGGARERKRE